MESRDVRRREQMKAPRLMLAGISSGSGITLVTCGLLAAWK